MVDDCKVVVLPLQELENAAAGVDSADALPDVEEGEHGVRPLHSTRVAASASLPTAQQVARGAEHAQQCMLSGGAVLRQLAGQQ